MVVGAGLSHWEQNNLLTVMEKVSVMERTVAQQMTQEEMDCIKQQYSAEAKLRFMVDKEQEKRHLFD